RARPRSMARPRLVAAGGGDGAGSARPPRAPRPGVRAVARASAPADSSGHAQGLQPPHDRPTPPGTPGADRALRSIAPRLRGGARGRSDRIVSLLHDPRVRRLLSAHLLCEVPTAGPRFALTFDDGPSPRNTPALLDALERHRARATFFVM